MATGATPHMLASQGKRTSFGTVPGNNAAHLLERSRAGLRGSTPDSEALASSDDEQDQLHRLQKVTSNPVAKPARRASWLTEGQQASNRNASISGGVPFSPISPGTTTTANDQNPWSSNVGGNNTGTAAGRGHANTASFPWSNTIWNTETAKGPPPRLTEVMPSPTSMVPPGSAGHYGDENLMSPRETSIDQAIPFAIPLQPTPKTYRSQSYSVGQLDPESMKAPPTNMNAATSYARPRVGTSYAGLQHRPSRPSMLGEMSHDPQSLGQLREVEDDDDSLDLSESSYQQPTDQARTIEQLTRENAMLRQAAAENRDRAAASHLLNKSPQRLHFRNRRDSRDAKSESSDQAVYETDDADMQKAFRNDVGRRFSEFGVKPGTQYNFSGGPEYRHVEGVKKGQWQSSLSFGNIVEPPQSRRHSFAEVPTRQNSTGPGHDLQNSRDSTEFGISANGKPVSPDGYPEGMVRPPQNESELEHLRDRDFAVSYFSRTEPTMRSPDGQRPSSSTALHQAYLQGHYGRPQQFGIAHNRPKQLLYIVTFKCQRADVFYVQEGTGLQVNKGDLVIVEADRGTDLGTVASDNVPWAEAKELKDKFIEEHHRWLMMFSQHGQNGTVAAQNPNGGPHGAVLGGSTSQPGLHDVPSGDLKPKMIKRVAQQHEIQSLREKEGAEAKAKRACQQKVVEHRLRMEILDAEFQMDWKKLTFFYFADSYINFNPLVTDLFKIYKTRIWMSAINTAAIASPAAGHHLLGGSNHRNYTPDVDEFSTRHQQRRVQDPPSGAPSTVGYPANEAVWNQGQEYGSIVPPSLTHLYGQPLPGPGFDMRHMSQMPISPYGNQPPGNMAQYYNSNDYASGAMMQKAAAYALRPDNRPSHPRERASNEGDWHQSFQRLSLER